MKPIQDQVVVITGATSGIGLATAYAAANKGARVVLVARNRAALNQIATVIRGNGGQVETVVADVSDRKQLQAAADTAIRAFGGFDTWVNNAGVGIFGRIEDTSEADHRRVFDVNYWGVVYGSQIAAAYLRPRGGAIINLGSILSEVSFPLQGAYGATKAAIRSFTDVLRMELEHDNAPVSVTLIKPSAIATPFAEHARNYMDHEPQLPPPLYAPEDVAETIVYAAEHGGRDYVVGGGGKMIAAVGAHLPRLLDVGAARLGPALSKQGRRPTRSKDGNLYAAGRDGDVRGPATSPVLRASVPSGGRAAKPVVAATVLALLGTALTVFGRRA